MINPLSISYYTSPNLSLPEVIECASNNNCKYIGVRMLSNQPGTNEMPVLYNKLYRSEIKKKLDYHGVKCLDANTLRVIKSSNPKDYLNFFDCAYDLKCTFILATIDDDNENRVIDKLNIFSEMAEDRSMSIEIEFVPWLKINNIATAYDLIKKSKAKNLGIAIDALHFFRSGSSLKLLKGIPSKYLRYFHICDARKTLSILSKEDLIFEATKNRLPPGDGDIKLKEIIEILPKEIPFAIEIPQLIKNSTSSNNKIYLEKLIFSIRNYLKKIFM